MINNTVQQGDGNAGSAAETTGKITAGDGLHIQTGTRSNQYINFAIDDMHCKALGLAASNILTRKTADDLLGDTKGALDWAIDKVLAQSTGLGAISARLEHTQNVLSIDLGNVASAESVIRDTHMAREMIEYAKNNILAQANQSAGRITELLQ